MDNGKIITYIIIAIIAIGAIAMIIGGAFNSGNNAKITIDCNDTTEGGQLMVIEFKDIEQNSNGTYNTSQFGTNEGVWNGDVVYIPIKDGKAEYKFTKGTQMFAIDSYITDLNKDYDYENESAPTFDVKLICDGKVVQSCSEQAYVDQCDVPIGGNIYFMNGTGFTNDDVNIDLPDLQDSYEFIFDLYHSSE